jgi:hypothetical protein
MEINGAVGAHKVTFLNLSESNRLRSAAHEIIACGEQRSITAQIVFVRGGATIGCDARKGANANRCTQSGIKITSAKHPLHSGEGWFSGAVTGGDVIDFVGIMQARGSFFDYRVLGCYQVESARDEVNVRIDLGRFGNDVLDARVRTANHQHDTFGRVDGQR